MPRASGYEFMPSAKFRKVFHNLPPATVKTTVPEEPTIVKAAVDFPVISKTEVKI